MLHHLASPGYRFREKPHPLRRLRVSRHREGVRPRLACRSDLELLDTNTPPALVPTVTSFIEGRMFHVAVENAVSQSLPICAGVYQGSCLTARLYVAFTNDIPSLSGQLGEAEDNVISYARSVC